MTFWFNKGNKSISINWYRKHAINNKKVYGTEDPDMRTGMVWGFHDNGAKKGRVSDTCYDCTLMLGYLEVGYTNWNYNNKIRLKS